MQPHRPDDKKLGGTRTNAGIVSHCGAASQRKTRAVGATLGACPRRGVPVNQAPLHGRSILRVPTGGTRGAAAQLRRIARPNLSQRDPAEVGSPRSAAFRTILLGLLGRGFQPPAEPKPAGRYLPGEHDARGVAGQRPQTCPIAPISGYRFAYLVQCAPLSDPKERIQAGC